MPYEERIADQTLTRETRTVLHRNEENDIHQRVEGISEIE